MSEAPSKAVRLVVLIACVSIAPGRSAAEGTAVKSFHLPSGIEVSVPPSWIVANESQLRAYENMRDGILKKGGVNPAATGEMARVPFQAMAAREPGSLFVMITVLPAESSQEEIASWSPGTIRRIGEALGEAQKKSLAAAGARDILVGPASVVVAGSKKAVFFTLEFTTEDGVRYAGEKYFIYTAARTVVYSTQVGTQRFRETAPVRERVLASLRVE